MPTDVELALRLLLSSALGGAVGLEREISDQPAGFRTHMLVAVGSCLFTLVSAHGFAAFLGGPAAPVRFDPTRIAAQIVTGIGFLGAGAILRYGMTVRGLTTAASLWVVAAIGLAVGAGTYVLAIVTAAITLLALFGLKPIRARLVRGLKKEHEELMLETDPDLELGDLVDALAAAGMRIDHFRVDDEDGERQVVLFVTLPPDRTPEDAVVLLTRTAGVRNVDWTR